MTNPHELPQPAPEVSAPTRLPAQIEQHYARQQAIIDSLYGGIPPEPPAPRERRATNRRPGRIGGVGRSPLLRRIG